VEIEKLIIIFYHFETLIKNEITKQSKISFNFTKCRLIQVNEQFTHLKPELHMAIG